MMATWRRGATGTGLCCIAGTVPSCMRTTFFSAATCCSVLYAVKCEAKKFLPFAGRANQRLHMIQVTFERSPAGCGQTVFRLRQPSVKRFGAEDIIRLFQFSCMHTQVSVRGLQERLQFVEGEGTVYRQRADNSQANPLVNQAVQVR